ncbi:MAG: T9SS type A sorting domain-containing protein, partial [Flavobacterium sp.]|nr:T9SS type A sorting domain-containing protein [Flavobacterium sp.]
MKKLLLFKNQGFKTMLLLGFLFLFSNYSWGQTTVFTETFGSTVANPYTGGTSSPNKTYEKTSTASTPGTASIVGTGAGSYLALAGAGVAGRTYLTTTLPSTDYNSTLNANLGIVTWTFNMRMNRTTNIDGLASSGANNVVPAYILVSNSSNLLGATTKGYAVSMAIGSVATTHKIQLHSFTEGLALGGAPPVVILSTGDFTAEQYFSIKVTYNPINNIWSIAAKTNGSTTSFSDPATDTYASTLTATNTVNTGIAMTHFGYFYQHSTATTTARFDNYKVVVNPPVTTPTITSTASSLTGLAYNPGAGPSNVRSTVISGTNLTGSIFAAVPTNYEISKDNFATAAATSALNLESGGTLSVRLKAGLITGTYPENISLSSSGAQEVTIACSGSVTESEPTAQATNLTFTSNSSTGFTINWTDASSGGGTNHLVVIKAATNITSNPTDATTYAANAAFTNGAALGGGFVVYNGMANTVTVTGLSKGTRYHVRVYDFNGSAAGTENYLITSPASSYQTTTPGEITSAQSGPWADTSTWVNNIVPTLGDDVIVSSNHIIDVSGATNPRCHNLTINSGGKLWSNGTKTIQIYGSSLSCTGTFGDSDATKELTTEFGNNLTISGTGAIYPYKLRPVPGLTNIGVTVNADTNITASNGTGIMSNTDVNNDNITYTINTGKTLTVRSNWATTSSINTAGAGNTIININGTCSITGAFATPVVSGKTCTVNINGTLNGGTSCSPFGLINGGVTTYNVNGILSISGNLNVTPIEAFVAPVINVGSSGVLTVNGTADFSSTTLSGYIGNAASTTGGTFNLGSGGTIKFAAVNGLEPIAGPIRTSTRNLNTGATYNFVGTVAQVPGIDFPATVNNMTINNAAGVTLGSGTTVSTNLTLTSGLLTTSGNLTLANAATIVRSAGSLSAAPTFGSTVNVTYNGATAISSDYEIPTESSVLNNLTVNNAAGVTLASATNLNNKLTVTSGTLTTAGLLTLKSAECCTAYVGQLATGAVTGLVTVERYIPGKRAWRSLTAPVIRDDNNSVFYNWQNAGNPIANTGVEIWSNNQTHSSVTNGGSGSSMLSYSSSGNSWSGVTDTSTTNLFSSTINNPFMVFVTGPYGSTNISNGYNATTLKATGSLIIGTKTYPTTGSQYTFIGNPYASPLSLTAMLDDAENSTNFSNGIWIWDSNGNASVGSYNYFDKTARAYSYNASSTPAVTPISASAEIQSGQAFFVQSSSGNGASFSIKEAHKGTSVINTVLRNDIPAQLLRVGLYKQENTEWSGRDGAMTVILNDANANQTPNKMANGTENIAFTKNAGLFASNHHLPLLASDVLNIRVWRTTTGANYKLKINTEQFASTSLNATLEDLFTNSRTPLNLEGTAVEYPFTVTTDALSSGDRFRIVFQNAVLGTNNPTATGFSIVPNPVTGDAFQVNLGTLATGIYTYYIYNAIGQEVEKGTLNNATQNTNYEVKMSNAATGIYIMKIK